MWLLRLPWSSQGRATMAAFTSATTTHGARITTGTTAMTVASMDATTAKRSPGGMQEAALPTRAALLRLDSERLVVERGWVGAGETEAFAVTLDEAIEVDAFAAARAGEALAFVAGEFAGAEGHADPLLAEELAVGELAVGAHLRFVLFEFGVEFTCALLGAFEGDDADAFVAIGRELRIDVDEGSGHLAPVAEFESALADAGSGDNADSVGGTAVDFNEDDGAFAVGIEVAIRQRLLARRADAESVHRKHRHTNAENLSSAEVSVRDLGFAEEFVELGDVDGGCGAHAFDATPVSASKWEWRGVRWRRCSGGRPELSTRFIRAAFRIRMEMAWAICAGSWRDWITSRGWEWMRSGSHRFTRRR